MTSDRFVPEETSIFLLIQATALRSAKRMMQRYEDFVSTNTGKPIDIYNCDITAPSSLDESVRDFCFNDLDKRFINPRVSSSIESSAADNSHPAIILADILPNAYPDIFADFRGVYRHVEENGYTNIWLLGATGDKGRSHQMLWFQPINERWLESLQRDMTGLKSQVPPIPLHARQSVLYRKGNDCIEFM